MPFPLQYQPEKNINLTTEKKYTYYYFQNDKINFHYYDLSKIHNVNNVEKFQTIYNHIFRGDIYFNYGDYAENTFQPEMYEIFIELGIMNRDDITFINMYNFYMKYQGLNGYLRDFADENILKKFQNYLLTFTEDKKEIMIINQIACLNNAYEFQDNIIIDKINNIYQNYDYVYICIAPGNNHYIPEFFTEKIINTYKTAIVYISKLDIDKYFHPFWINVSEDQQNNTVSESIITSTFNDINKKLINNLDIYIFEYELVLQSFFFDSLNKVITKNTLFYYGISVNGDWAKEQLDKMKFLDNRHIKLYRPKDKLLFKDTNDFLQNGGISLKNGKKHRVSKRRKNGKSRRS
jgi:hypothetical protein